MQLVFSAVMVGGSGEVTDITTVRIPENSDESNEVKVCGKVKQSKLSFQLKSSVVTYLQSHTVVETCAQFGVSRRNVVRWKREETNNSASWNKINSKEKFRLTKFKCKKETISPSNNVSYDEDVNNVKDVKIDTEVDVDASVPSINSSNPLSCLSRPDKFCSLSDMYVMTNLPHDKAKLKDIWDMMLALEDEDGERVYSCLLCDRKFRGRYANNHARSHVDQNHTTHIQHKCHLCHFSSKRNRSLYRHILKLHRSMK